jgi:hypothetical protein
MQLDERTERELWARQCCLFTKRLEVFIVHGAGCLERPLRQGIARVVNCHAGLQGKLELHRITRRVALARDARVQLVEKCRRICVYVV